MAHAAAKHKPVPDRVVIGDALADVKNDPQRIDHAPNRQQRHAARRQFHRQLINHYQRQPAHRQISHQRQYLKAVCDGEFEQDPQQGQAPDNNH